MKLMKDIGVDPLKLCYSSALLYAFLISFDQKAVTWALILWLIVSIISWSRLGSAQLGYQHSLVVLFITYALSMIFLEYFSLQRLEHKLSLLVFPVIFSVYGYTTEERDKILRAFVLGLFFSSVLCLLVALNRSLAFVKGDIVFRPNLLEGRGFIESIMYGGNYFFGRHFSIFHQTVYLALYLCSGIAILLFKNKMFTLRIRLSLMIFFMVTLFLVSNKAGFVVIGLVFLARIFSIETSVIRKLLAILLLLVVSLTFLYINPRLRAGLSAVNRGELRLEEKARYGIGVRLLSWDAAITLISRKPLLGYGGGKAQKELNNLYAQKGYLYPLKKHLNAHNQFLQTWIENGLIGFLALIAIYILILFVVVRSKKDTGLMLSFLIILFINGLFESTLNRFSGVSFFSFLVCFIFSGDNANKIKR